MSTRTLRVLRRAETDQTDTLYAEEAKVIAEAERLLGSGLPGEEARAHYAELLQKYQDLLEDHKRVQRLSDQWLGRMRQEQKRSKALLAEFERLVQVFGDIMQVVNSSTKLEHVLQVIVDRAVGLCGADGGSVYTIDPSSGSYELRGSCNTSESLVEILRSSGEILGTTVVGKAVAERRRMEVHDLAGQPDTPLRQALAAEGFRSVLVLPLVRGDDVLGALVVRRKTEEQLAESSVELLETFARHAASAIFNARLADERECLNLALSKQVKEQERDVARLKRFFSPQVAERILRDEDGKIFDNRLHRGYITVVFCDLRGWTDFALRTEPEDVMEVLGEYHREIGSLVFRYEGTLERFTGDGLMVFFNDPEEIAQPALTAVRMAVEMRDRALELIHNWHKRDHELGFGIGIDQGHASLGTIGFEGRYDYAAVGAVVNRAARLCAAAAPGQILISQRVLGDVSTEIEFEAVGKLKLKGCGPTSAFNVARLRSVSEVVASASNDDTG